MKLLKVSLLAAEVGALQAVIKQRSMIYQVSAKEDAARRERLPLHAFYDLDFTTWSFIRDRLYQPAWNLAADMAAETKGVLETTPYIEIPVFRHEMGYDVHQKITNRKKLLALPWPDEVPVLTEKDIDGYAESLGKNRKHLWDWLRATFDRTLPDGQMLHDQFTHVLYEVMRECCDRRDHDIINISGVPTTPGYQLTKAPYSPAEVAEWWNEALRRVGYDV